MRVRDAYADISARTDCPDDLESVVVPLMRAEIEDGAVVEQEGAGEGARRTSYSTFDCCSTHFFVLCSCVECFV